MFLCLTGFLKQKYKEINNFELSFDNFSKNIHSFVNLGIYFRVRLKLKKKPSIYTYYTHTLEHIMYSWMYRNYSANPTGQE